MMDLPRCCGYLEESLAHSDSASVSAAMNFALLPANHSPQPSPCAVASKCIRRDAPTAAACRHRRHGSRVAIFPQDAEQAEQLIRIADERLYRLKQANTAKAATVLAHQTPSAPEAPAAPAPQRAVPAPQPISIETKRAPDKTETTIAAAASAPPRRSPRTSRPFAVFAVQRKAERVSMTGTNATLFLATRVSAAPASSILALAVSPWNWIPRGSSGDLLAVLHVPILPPVRVNLKPVWKQLTSQVVSVSAAPSFPEHLYKSRQQA